MNNISRNSKRCPTKINSIIRTIKRMNELEIESIIDSLKFGLGEKRIEVRIGVLRKDFSNDSVQDFVPEVFIDDSG